uniref:Uncharacterized protein n=1 Tax=Arundo donax TaxID=35708 RepID=A0A0A9FGK3_ARUDO
MERRKSYGCLHANVG